MTVLVFLLKLAVIYFYVINIVISFHFVTILQNALGKFIKN